MDEWRGGPPVGGKLYIQPVIAASAKNKPTVIPALTGAAILWPTPISLFL